MSEGNKLESSSSSSGVGAGPACFDTAASRDSVKDCFGVGAAPSAPTAEVAGLGAPNSFSASELPFSVTGLEAAPICNLLSLAALNFSASRSPSLFPREREPEVPAGLAGVEPAGVVAVVAVAVVVVSGSFLKNFVHPYISLSTSGLASLTRIFAFVPATHNL